jgi:hypothetical protein
MTSALKALAAAKEARIAVEVEGEKLVLRGSDLSNEIVDLFIANKPDLMRVYKCREAANAIFLSQPPLGCWPNHWSAARRSVIAFVQEGWGDQAALMGWTPEELYKLPPAWGRLDLTGAALLIGDRKVVEVTEAAITTKGLRGTELKFRRAGREHLS